MYYFLNKEKRIIEKKKMKRKEKVMNDMNGQKTKITYFYILVFFSPIERPT